MSTVWLIYFYFFIILGSSNDSILSYEFYTNHFTDEDFSNWASSGNTLPADHLFSDCGGKRIFGGYKVFGGDPFLPAKISRHYPALIAHYGVKIQAQIYKIDSWNNQNFYLLVDNIPVKIYTFGSINSTVDICGDPSPVTDSINSNFNDTILTIDINHTHKASTLDISLETDLNSNRGWWGIRNLKISLYLCDKSCLTCDNSTACTSCDSTIADGGLTLAGAFCECINETKFKEKLKQCTIMPCVRCVSVCTDSEGYYLSAISNQCQPCNIACSSCTGPSNSNNTVCTACAVGYNRTNPITQPCFSCFGSCSACNSLSSTDCTACKQSFFLHNTQCLSYCPPGTYSRQKTRQCMVCSTSCAKCDGPSDSYCTACTGSLYLHANQCLAACPAPYLKYSNVCYQQCPQGTYSDLGTLTCVGCVSNCLQCTLTGICTSCNSTFYKYSGGCVTNCPSTHYGSNVTQECIVCHSDCLTCDGPTSTSCLTCSNPSYVLLNKTCFASCPISTYGPSCLPCHPQCLQCSGGNQNQCTQCHNNQFLEISTNQCLKTCRNGQISDDINWICSECPIGQVGYMQQCVSCSEPCLTCNGIGFMQCTSCNHPTFLSFNTCVLQEQPYVILSRASSLGSSQVLKMFAGLSLGLCIIFEAIFVYKTLLLPLIEYCQIISFLYVLVLPVSEQVQRILYFFYQFNLSPILTFQPALRLKLPTKLALLDKTGYFILDSLVIHLCFLVAVLLFFLVKKVKSLNQIFMYIYSKINPYLLSYLYRLLIIEQVFCAAIFISYGEISSFIGIASLVLLLLDAICLAFTFIWKVKPTDRKQKQYALFYFNQIQQKYFYLQSNSQAHHNSNNKKTVLFNFIFYLGKVPFIIALVYFIDNATYQLISLATYSVFFLIMVFIVPYKRKIYRWVYTVLALILTLLSCMYFGVRLNQALSISIELILLLMVLGIFIVILFQILVNYQLLVQFYTYLKYHFKNLKNTSLFVHQNQKGSQQGSQNSSRTSTISKQSDVTKSKKYKQKNGSQEIYGQAVKKNIFDKSQIYHNQDGSVISIERGSLYDQSEITENDRRKNSNLQRKSGANSLSQKQNTLKKILKNQSQDYSISSVPDVEKNKGDIRLDLDL